MWSPFLTPREKLRPLRRLILLSLNHALLFLLVVLLLPPMHADWISYFSVGFGIAMIAAGALVSRREPPIWHSASQQGALVIALGLFTAVAGPHPVLVVAIVCALLLVTGTALGERWGEALRFLAEVVALVAVLMAFEFVCGPGQVGRVIGVITGLILIGCACLARRVGPSRPAIDWHAVYLAALACGLVDHVVINFLNRSASSPGHPGSVLTISYAVLRVPELPYLAKGFVLAALVLWLAQLGSFERPWWNPFVVIVITLALSRWWQTRGADLIPGWELILVQVVAAIGAVAVLFFWLEGTLPPVWRLVVASTLSVATFLYGILTRDWAIAALGQAFSFASLYEFCGQLAQGPPPSWF